MLSSRLYTRDTADTPVPVLGRTMSQSVPAWNFLVFDWRATTMLPHFVSVEDIQPIQFLGKGAGEGSIDATRSNRVA